MTEKILTVKNLNKTFVSPYGRQRAVKDVSFHIERGESLGLVGESGCGKSTIAKLITRLLPVDHGSVSLCGEEMTKAGGKALRRSYRHVQMIFQDPVTSFDPRISIGKSISSVLLHHGLCARKEVEGQVCEVLAQVGLGPAYAKALPLHISGGECQRAAIARAIAVRPKLLICDEATSALDVSVQAQIVNLLTEIGRDYGMSFLFISHDLALVSAFCSRILVMYRGEIIEEAASMEILRQPRQPYTKLLLSSVFSVAPGGI